MRLIILILAFALLGCSKPTKTVKMDGFEYVLVRPPKTNDNIVDIELWQKKGSTNLYIRSLSQNMMIPISR